MIRWTESPTDEQWKQILDFICTEKPDPLDIEEDPFLKDVYEAELEAQTAIRSMPTPLPGSDHVIAGFDADGLVAVAWWFVIGHNRIKLLSAGVSLQKRKKFYGDELMVETLEALTRWGEKHGYEVLSVHCLVRRYNWLSQEWLRRFGWFYASDTAKGELQEWWCRLEVRGESTDI